MTKITENDYRMIPLENVACNIHNLFPGLQEKWDKHFKPSKKRISYIAYFQSLITSEYYAANPIQKFALVLEI